MHMCCVRNITVPLLFRTLDHEEDWTLADTSTTKSYRIVSNPVLLQLPNQMTCAQLYEAVEAFVPFALPYCLRYVNSTVCH